VRSSWGTRAAALVLLLLAGLGWVGPSHAFNYATGWSRTITVATKANPSAYEAPIVLDCPAISKSGGGSCPFALFDNFTSSVFFTVTLQADPLGLVSSFDVDGNGTASGVGHSATGKSVAVGSSSTVHVTLASDLGCLTSCTDNLQWIVAAQSGGALDFRQEHLTQNATWSAP
jgi:hypothetical protein